MKEDPVTGVPRLGDPDDDKTLSLNTGDTRGNENPILMMY